MKVSVKSANPISLKKLLVDADYVWASAPNGGVAVILKNVGANNIGIEVGAYKKTGTTDANGNPELVDSSVESVGGDMYFFDSAETISIAPNTVFPSFNCYDLDNVILKAETGDTDLLVSLIF